MRNGVKDGEEKEEKDREGTSRRLADYLLLCLFLHAVYFCVCTCVCLTEWLREWESWERECECADSWWQNLVPAEWRHAAIIVAAQPELQHYSDSSYTNNSPQGDPKSDNQGVICCYSKNLYCILCFNSPDRVDE